MWDCTVLDSYTPPVSCPRSLWIAPHTATPHRWKRACSVRRLKLFKYRTPNPSVSSLSNKYHFISGRMHKYTHQHACVCLRARLGRSLFTSWDVDSHTEMALISQMPTLLWANYGKHNLNVCFNGVFLFLLHVFSSTHLCVFRLVDRFH